MIFLVFLDKVYLSFDDIYDVFEIIIGDNFKRVKDCCG